MRARKKKNTVPRLERNGKYIVTEIIPTDKPLIIEIGCGKGAFAATVSELYDCDYYALEKVPDVIVMAVEKAAERDCKNLKFIIGDAQDLSDICPSGAADVIYLNFSDPWPKKRDTKKRLTYRAFLDIYARLLKPDGVLKIKTDNSRLFNFTLSELNATEWRISELTRDLHKSTVENPCMTEYETRFTALGQPIYNVWARKKESITTEKTILKNATVYGGDFEPINADIAFENGKITEIGKLDGDGIDITGLTVLPGLVDIHIHGCGGADTGDATPAALEAMSECLASKGITSFCPTSMTLSYEELTKIFANVRDMKDRVGGAYIHGVNMEGPYIAMSKKGAQNALYVRNPDKEEFKRLYDGCDGCIRLVDIAPECAGAEEFIKEIQPLCPVSTAHTAAGYDEACKAIEWGVRHTTHLYNAQSGLNHRAPGVVGAVFDKTRQYGVRAELICDGFHIHPAALRIAFSVLGEDNSVIISDSMRAAGHKDGVYDLGGQEVFVKDGKALLADGTIAASTSNLYEELKNVIRFGIPKKQAIKSATINPAKAIRADALTGSVETGKYADLLIVDDDLNIKYVYIKGRLVRSY